jgi:hypothetical protein
MENRMTVGEGGVGGGNEPSGMEREVLEAIRAIKYGSIEITLHDGQIVQIERREKIRIKNGAVGTKDRSAAA